MASQRIAEKYAKNFESLLWVKQTRQEFWECLPQHTLGGRKIKTWRPSFFRYAFVLPQHSVRSGIPPDLTLFSELRNQDQINLTIASSSGKGVTAVMLPRFSTNRDPRRNCEKFIQMFKD